MGRRVTCYRCGEPGTLVTRWVQSYYYPKKSSVEIIDLQEAERKLKLDPDNVELQNWVKYIRLTKVKGSLTLIEAQEQGINGKTLRYGIKSKKYLVEYVYHYSKEKYQQMKLEYNDDPNNKPKPTGTIWHNQCVDTFGYLARKRVAKQKQKEFERRTKNPTADDMGIMRH